MEKKPFAESESRDWGFLSPSQVSPIDPTEVAAILNPDTIGGSMSAEKCDPLRYLPGRSVTVKVEK